MKMMNNKKATSSKTFTEADLIFLKKKKAKKKKRYSNGRKQSSLDQLDCFDYNFTKQKDKLISERMNKIRYRLVQLGMARSTRSTRIRELRNFFRHIGKVENITQNEVTTYLDYLITHNKYIPKHKNAVAKIIKFYRKEFLDKGVK